MRPLLICLALTACADMPVVTWPEGAPGATPDLIPLAGLSAADATLQDDPGTALAAEAEALKARAAAIPDY